MYLRPEPTLTLADLHAEFDRPREEATAESGRQITVTADAAAVEVQTPRGERKEIPLTDASWESLGTILKIPDSFANRLPTPTRVNLTNDLLHRYDKSVTIRFDQTGILSAHDPRQIPFEPRHLIDVAQRVVGDEASVIEVERTLTAFSFDTVTAAGVRELGDLRVNDITRSGLRFSQNLRQNLAPSVAKYAYRLICTNGMEVPDASLKLDARGSTIDEVLEDLEALAQRAFAEVESDIEHFYAMREEQVQHPERTLNRMAQDFGVSDRIRHELIEAVPTVVGEDGTATMFDLVNLITNSANRDGVTRGTRISLERTGGRAVSTHIQRCRSCSSRIL